MGYAANVFRQTGVGNTGHHKRGVFRQITNMLGHAIRTRCAVQSQNIDRKGFQNGHHSANITPHQHGSGGFHGHRHHQRQPGSPRFKGLFNATQGRLNLQYILAGFHNQQIRTAIEQARRLFRIGRLHGVEINVTQGG